ncbi:MAG: WD40 repeat domain-containing protein, partial [Polyangiales bacterium]
MGVPSFILQRLHRVHSASCQRVLETDLPARCIAYGEEGTEILVGHEDGVPRLWDTAHFTLARAFTPHDAPILSVAPRGSRWATSCAHGRVRVWGAFGEPIREFREMPGEEAPCWSVAWNREGTRLLTAHEDKTVRVYDPDRGKGRKRMRLPFTAHAVAFGPEESQIALTIDGAALVWEGEREMASAELSLGEPRPDIAHHVSFGFSRDRRMIAAAVRSHDIHLSHWDDTVTVLQGHTDVVTSLAWSPEGRFLLSGSEDYTARIWDTTTRDCVATLNDVAAIWAVAFHPHGHDCATMSEDGSLRIYELGSTWYDLHQAIAQAALALEGRRAALWPTTAPVDLDFVLDVWSDLRRRARHQRIPPDLAERGERVRQTVLELLALLCADASPDVPQDGLERFKHPLFRVALADLRLATELCQRLGGDLVAVANLH